jgi:hypothetical protein
VAVSGIEITFLIPVFLCRLTLSGEERMMVRSNADSVSRLGNLSQRRRQDNLSVFVRSLMIAFCHITFASLAYGERADDYSEIELPSAR